MLIDAPHDFNRVERQKREYGVKSDPHYKSHQYLSKAARKNILHHIVL